MVDGGDKNDGNNDKFTLPKTNIAPKNDGFQ